MSSKTEAMNIMSNMDKGRGKCYVSLLGISTKCVLLVHSSGTGQSLKTLKKKEKEKGRREEKKNYQ